MEWFINELLGNIWNNVRLFIDWLSDPFMDPLEFLKKLRKGRISVPAGVRRVLIFLIVTAVVVTLGVLTWTLGLDRHASGPWFFRKTWMGWIALLAYIILQLFVTILRQVRLLPPLLHTWIDIDRGIDAGRYAIAEAGLRLDQIPMFLVVGLSSRAEQMFVQSQQVGRLICVDGPELPVHWYGDEKAIWITLPGVASTGLQAESFLKDVISEQDASALGQAADASVDPAIADRNLLITSKQRTAAKNRLAYFCQELRALRSPVCAANAVILVVPFNERMMLEDRSRGVHECVRTDMTILQENLGVRCLAITILAGAQDNPALTSYIRSNSAGAADRRFGATFPQFVQFESTDTNNVYDWCLRSFELQAMEIYREHPGDKRNEMVFRFVDMFRNSKGYFSGVLSNAFDQQVSNRFYFGGVYLAELSQVGSQSAPLLNGVLKRVLQEHDELISWSDRALEEDARNRRFSYFLFAVSAIMLVAGAGLVWNIAAS